MDLANVSQQWRIRDVHVISCDLSFEILHFKGCFISTNEVKESYFWIQTKVCYLKICEIEFHRDQVRNRNSSINKVRKFKGFDFLEQLVDEVFLNVAKEL